MMVAIFATMALALLAARFGPSWLAVACVLVCLALSMGLFLWEIYSPEYGFRMPWLQTMIHAAPHAPASGQPA